MIPKYCINIFLVIVFIIILFNLKQNLNNNFKNNSNNIVDNNIIEKFDGTIKEHTVENIDKAIKQVINLGGSKINEPVKSKKSNVKVVYCNDPEGTLIELVEI